MKNITIHRFVWDGSGLRCAYCLVGWLATAFSLAACSPARPPAAPGPTVVSVATPPPAPLPPADASPPPDDTRPAPASPTSLGRSKEASIEVCGPRGERAYLARLRCRDGRPPLFERQGNVGSRHEPKPGTPDQVLMDQMDASRLIPPGETDYHIIDIYDVVCSDSRHDIYMDMYHCVGPQTTDAPAGFTIIPEPGEGTRAQQDFTLPDSAGS